MFRALTLARLARSALRGRSAKALILLVVAQLPSLSVAQEEPLWRTVDGWQIRVDTTLNNGCFIYQIFEGNSVLRLGMANLDNSDYSFYVMIGDMDWQSLEEGKEYPIEIKFGTAEPWRGDASAEVFADIPVLWLFLSDQDQIATFIEEFMRKRYVKVIYERRTIAHLSLKSSFKAGMALLECQKAANDIRDASKDPFRAGSGNGNDPFKD